METTNNHQTFEKTDETQESANKWVNDFSTEMLNIYNRQLNTVFDFYKNVFNSFSGSNKNDNGSEMNFTNPFLKNGQMFKSMFRPFKMDGNFTGALSSQYEHAGKQLNEFGNNVFNGLQKESQQSQKNWNELSEKYGKIFEDRFKASRDIINSMTETYFKQLNFSIEANRKALEEMNKQFGSVLKQNEKLWSDVLKTTETFDKTEKENKTENKFVPSKKQAVHS